MTPLKQLSFRRNLWKCVRADDGGGEIGDKVRPLYQQTRGWMGMEGNVLYF
jgi:hypothetical protein